MAFIPFSKFNTLDLHADPLAPDGEERDPIMLVSEIPFRFDTQLFHVGDNVYIHVADPNPLRPIQ